MASLFTFVKSLICNTMASLSDLFAGHHDTVRLIAGERGDSQEGKEGSEIYVPRQLLVTHSPVFKAMFEGI